MKYIVIGLIVVGVLFFIMFPRLQGGGGSIVSDFDSCMKAGNPVMESYPRQCRAGEKMFVENIGNELEKQDLIRITFPRPGQTIESPTTITGEARGYWFFEASFPIELFNADGGKIGTAIAQAQDEWMTEEFVPFEATLSFSSPRLQNGTLVLKKDNPSGLPENDDELSVRIRLATSTQAVSAACRPTGCSGQICSNEDVITTCEYQPQYSCYQNAECKRQVNGECGWTQSQELLACLNSF